eukprot:11787398-Alexandrium_andersonii.AAC.1
MAAPVWLVHLVEERPPHLLVHVLVDLAHHHGRLLLGLPAGGLEVGLVLLGVALGAGPAHAPAAPAPGLDHRGPLAPAEGNAAN